jgi:acetyl-CoA carboxylase carboxyltransferase component
MGPEGAVNIIFRDELKKSRNPAALRKRLISEYREKFANPYIAAERGYVDAIIEPAETRRRVIAAFERLANKRDTNPRRKHGNLPL